MELSELSRKRLEGVHPDLVRVVEDVASNAPFEILVVDGRRTPAQQKKYYDEGKSKTLNSRHLHGMAVDLCALVDGDLKWGKPHNKAIAELMKAAAQEADIPIEWGGDFKSFVDTPHWQLPHSDYPDQDQSWVKAAPAKSEVHAVLQKSRKHRAAGWTKWGMGITGGITAGWPTIKEQITIGSDILATVQNVIATNGLLVVSGICIISAITFNWLQQRQREDFEQGRYTPSGVEQ